MKKTVLGLILMVIICLCGCVREVNYVTKYITNCETTELRQRPVNSAAVIHKLKAGESVSFESDDANGYSKVVYNGITGYILSAFLTDVRPEEEEASSETKSASADTAEIPAKEERTKSQTQTRVQADKYSSLISTMNEDDIESLITSYIRPLYYNINDSLSSYVQSTSGSATVWNDQNGCVKKEYVAGADNYEYSRQYYFDTQSGKLIFAFVFYETEEYRLYFDGDKLIRFIDDSETVYNNPTHEYALEMALHAVKEAY